MKLYYAKGACSFAPRIIINELHIPCEFNKVDLKTKRTKNDQDFLKINPKGAVPVIETDDKHILTENAVILQYLADHYKGSQLLPPISDFKRYRVLEWLNYVATELHKGYGPLFNSAISQDLKEQIFIPLLKKKFDYVNRCLAEKSYLLGDRFTLPDAYLFTILVWTKHFDIDITESEHLARYYSSLENRESIKKAFGDES